MKETIVKYQKEKVVIPINIFVCACGQEMTCIGSAGCSHADEYTYTYQCPFCKTIGMSEKSIRGYGHSDEEFIKAGWKRV